MVEEEEPKGYWEANNEPNGQLWTEVVDKELDSLDRARTWDVMDKVEGGKEVGSKWVFKMKRLVDRSIDKFKARFVV
jgi:predicted mannosyl-3-phosphoglycerate phosphatase (HAD superfamily)